MLIPADNAVSAAGNEARNVFNGGDAGGSLDRLADLCRVAADKLDQAGYPQASADAYLMLWIADGLTESTDTYKRRAQAEAVLGVTMHIGSRISRASKPGSA